MIDISDIAALVAGITSSVILSAVLFTVAWIHSGDKTRYTMLLRMYAMATLLDSGLMLCLLYLVLNNIDYQFIRYFVQPTIVSVETGLGAYGIFRHFRGSSLYLRQVQFSCYGFMAAVLLYPVMYGIRLGFDNEFWDVSNYLLYARSTEGIIASLMIYVTAFVFNFFTTKNIFDGYHRYKEILVKYISFDPVRTRRICMTFMGLCLSYVLMAYLNIMAESPAVHHVLQYLMIIIFMGMVLILISNSDTLKRIDSAFRSIKIHDIELLYDADGESHSEYKTQDVREIRKIMEHWAKRSDKPYNEMGITLKSVSDDMQLPMSIVLKYVHICYGMGFRSWILTLRDESL